MDKARLKRERNKVLLFLLLYIRIFKEKKNLNILRRRYLHPTLKLKQQQGDWHNLIYEMRLEVDETFFNYMRMTSSMFDALLVKVGPTITKIETNWRIPIPAAARLAMTIRYIYIYNLDIF